MPPATDPPRIEHRPLAYVAALSRRPAAAIEGVVVHCTELPDLAMAREFGEQCRYPGSGTGNSGHYYIDRDGRIEQWVAPERVAHHCRGCNDTTIGIELVNLGRYPHWLHSEHQQLTEPYPPAQVHSLLQLLDHLQDTLPALRWIAGHQDLDPELVPASDRPDVRVHRKLDPGPRFPWQQVLRQNGLQRRWRW